VAKSKLDVSADDEVNNLIFLAADEKIRWVVEDKLSSV
jgi:hypothetical protein